MSQRSYTKNVCYGLHYYSPISIVVVFAYTWIYVPDLPYQYALPEFVNGFQTTSITT